ncbi:TonB-dependent siderophore receptor [Tardiphaga sp.]|uniref:TonB-dependent siderophore receptor n=1 Tax=Tardiphaga sp. TaxID=1926292 RepID=UPI0026313E4E|nr:TonB-dependent siderophore receptor [Tardiphaga sp.]MDB5620058.1 TonB-dependent siderophore receptor [Tardiphaga sp.]
MKKIHLLRLALLSSACAFSALTLNPALAQSNAAAQSGVSQLPPVVINQPEARGRAAAVAPRRAARSARSAAASRAPVAPRNVPFVENPRGAIQGYVANRSMAGTKTNTAINETPQAITVIGAEQIRDQKPQKFDEVLRYSPGVVGGYFGADVRNDWYLIRGFKADDNSTFLDGMQLFSTAFATWKLQPTNLERVEVLRGPASVLYGGSSTGGIVNAVSKLPTFEPIRYIETGVNNYGNGYVSFDVGGPIAVPAQNGALAYRVVGQVKGGETQTDFTPDNNYFIAPSLTWKPDADTSFTLLASASRNESRVQNFLPYEGTVTAAPYGRISTGFFGSQPSLDKFTREQEMIGYLFEKRLSENVTFRQNARYGHTDVNLTTLQGLGTDAAGDLSRLYFTTHGVADQANLDNQLEYRFATGDVQHTTLFGLDLRHYSINDYQASLYPAASINVINPVYTNTPYTGAAYRDGTLTQKQIGLYAQDQIKWNRFTLVLSGRNDFVTTTDESRLGAGSNASRDDSKFSGRAGLIYNFDNGIAPYVSYATSYNPLTGVVFSTGAIRLPETGQQTEVGLKYQPAGFNGHFGAALFDLTRQNTPSVDFTNSLLSSQLGEVRSRGIELEAVANPLPGLKLVASHTAYNIEITQEAASYLVGKVPVNTPRQMTSGWADYTFQTGPLAGFGLGGGVRYIGASFADANNLFVVPSFVLGDLAVHYEWQNWRAAVNVQNVGDETYVASCANTTSCFYGDRRRVSASLGYKW